MGLRDVTDVSAKKALLDGAKKSIGELMAACRKVQGSSKKSCKDMLKEEIKARITSSKLADDKDGNEDEDEGDDEDEETGAPAETFVERIKRDIRVSEIGRTISACMKVCRVESSKFSCYRKCTEEAKEAAAAATAADKDEIDEVTVTLDTESAAEERAAEVCEASGNCDPSSTEEQEAFNEVLPGDVIDTEIPEKVRTNVQQRRRRRMARIALLKRKIAACKNAKKLDLLKCIKEEASDKVLPQEGNEIEDDAETTRSLRDAIERNAFDSLRACVKSGKLQDCLKTFAEALKVKKSGNSKTKDALLRMRARIFAAASACGSDECKAKAEEAAARLGEKLRALKVVDRFAAETKAVDNMADVADGEDDKDVEATGKATCEKFSSCAWKAAKKRLIATAKARKNKVPKVVREEKKVDVDIVKTGLTEASCKEMLSKFVTQMRSSPKMKDKLAKIGQLMKPKFEKEKKRCTAAARMTISSDEIEKVSEEVAQEASKALKSSAGRRFLSESSASVGQTTKLAFDGFEGDDEVDENDVSEEVSGNFGWIGVIGGILLVAAVVAGVYYATQKSGAPSNSMRLDNNDSEGVSMTVINPGAVSGLPAGWKQAVDKSGNTYYYNKSLGETSWTLPEA